MADNAIGIAKPTVIQIHPDNYPTSGWNSLVKKAYAPPDRVTRVPISA